MRRGLPPLGMVLIVALGSACSPMDVGRGVLGLSRSQPSSPYQSAVKQVWSLNNKMNMTLDASLPDRFETGNAVIGDRAYIAGRKAQGVGPELQSALPVKRSTEWVPPQDGTPPHFLTPVDSYEAH